MTDTPLKTVLIVDDDAGMRLLLSEALLRAGFAIIEAEDAVTALQQLERQPPDIALIDVEMPGMNGFQLCSRIRELTDDPLMPIVMVTGHDDDESVHKAYDVGATDFCSKPINWAQLGHRLRYLLRAGDAHRQRRLSESRLGAVMEAIPDLIFRVSGEGVYLACEGGENIDLVPGHADLIGRSFGDVMSPLDADLSRTSVRRALIEGSIQQYEYQLKSGEETRSFEARLVPTDEDEVYAIVRDITDRKEAEQQIKYMAYYDTLTGLPNRAQFMERLDNAILYTERHDYALSVFYLDLDQFKLINDTLGHNIGDGLLISVGERLLNITKLRHLSALRSSKFIFEAARIGGDEFVLFFSMPNADCDMESIVQEILHEIARPHSVSGHEIFVTPSIGIATYPLDGRQSDTLLKNADIAMYQAKKAGRNGFRFFSETMSEQARQRLTIENDLRRALENEEFELHYQPQITTSDCRIFGAEVLLRWNHPELGQMAPGQFIQIAEETGLIVPITSWVLEKACCQAKVWRRSYSDFETISVNVSAQSFLRNKIRSDVTQALAASGLEAQHLELEFTEGMLMHDTDQTLNAVNGLRNAGVRFSIDDFGTGYSSLSYLKRFPLDTLKIDKCFVDGINADNGDADIVIAIIAMAKSLGLQVIAEGVETDAQYEFLQQKECDAIQGFWYSRPLNAESFTAKLAENYVACDSRPSKMTSRS